jgi:hypothetical protein
MLKRTFLAVLMAFCSGALLPTCSAQSGGDTPKFGLAASAGSLGAGVEGAVSVLRRSNVRFGFNYFSYSLSGTDSNNNLGYSGKLRLASAEALWDQYLAGPVHISAGALIYDGFQGTGNVHVPGGGSFSLNGTTYYSDASDPVTGTGMLSSRKVAPEVLLGFGNLAPRRRHFTVNVDLGVAFQGSLNAKLNLGGSACAGLAMGCAPISAQPAVQANIVAEQSRINNSLAPFKYYPVVRLSIGYRF